MGWCIVGLQQLYSQQKSFQQSIENIAQFDKSNQKLKLSSLNEINSKIKKFYLVNKFQAINFLIDLSSKTDKLQEVVRLLKQVVKFKQFLLNKLNQNYSKRILHTFDQAQTDLESKRADYAEAKRDEENAIIEQFIFIFKKQVTNQSGR